MTGRILLCTLGGSTEPIDAMLRAESWRHVVFICTADDPASEQAGSLRSIEALAATCGALMPSRETVIVPPDALDQIVGITIEAIDRLRRTMPGAELVADYTGGTKSMSAGLVLASLSRRPGVTLQITTGRRSDLVRVTNKTERPLDVAMSRIVVERQMEVLSAGWHEFGYEAASLGFEKLWRQTKSESGPRELVGELRFRAELSGAFAAWDRFGHGDAATQLARLRRYLPADQTIFCDISAKLKEEGAEKMRARFLQDLLLNAERCARRGRYDDAVARLYRLWEATVQWLLLVGENRETKRIDPCGLPDAITGGQYPNPRTGTIELGSARAWALWRYLQPGSAAARFWADPFEGIPNEKAYRDYSQHRNVSILAHGTQPVKFEHWTKVHHWTANSFMEMVRAEAIRFGEDCTAPQLPTEIPERVRGSER